MGQDELLILSGHEVAALLRHREAEIIEAVRLAYEAHGRGADALPHSVFLRFADRPKDRIIALPAYVGDGFQVAGLKWIASFPGNHGLGLDRASAVIIINSTTTGRPLAILEGSVVSAKRTAASAALAARCLRPGAQVPAVALIGCGLINYETARFLLKIYPEIERLILFDVDPAAARRFREKCSETFGGVDISLAQDIGAALAQAPLICVATTAAAPHITDLPGHAEGTTVLHTSLRDLSPELILRCDNVVDDIDHVCRAETSIHLTEQLVGHRDFIRGTLPDVLLGKAKQRSGRPGPTVFSPFGLGVLDLAVSKLVLELATQKGVGTRVGSFLPAPWFSRP